jgi:hypothetical protein
MVAPIPRHDLFLVLGPARLSWPEPLGTLARGGEVRVQAVASFHEAAAEIAAGGSAIRALLLDPKTVMLGDLRAAQTIVRHTGLPIVMLPLTPGAGARAKEASEYGVLPWAKAKELLDRTVSHQRATAPFPLNLRVQAHPAMTDNRRDFNVGGPAEISMTYRAAIRYDDSDTCPLITPQEMQALLGLED